MVGGAVEAFSGVVPQIEGVLRELAAIYVAEGH
jgi:hypothetical protein